MRLSVYESRGNLFAMQYVSPIQFSALLLDAGVGSTLILKYLIHEIFALVLDGRARLEQTVSCIPP